MDDLIKRVKELYGYESDAALARGLEISPQNYYAQKKTRKIKNSLLLHGMEKGASRAWLLTGQPDITAGSKGGEYTDILKRYIIHLSMALVRLSECLIFSTCRRSASKVIGDTSPVMLADRIDALNSRTRSLIFRWSAGSLLLSGFAR